MWEEMALRSHFPGLSVRQSQGLLAFLVPRLHHAHTVLLYGGHWRARDLGAAVSSLQPGYLMLANICCYCEAELISDTLSCEPVSLGMSGSQQLDLPASLQWLEAFVGSQNSRSYLEQLSHLAGLLYLNVSLPPDSETQVNWAALGEQHPQLQYFKLRVQEDSLKQDLSSLALPAACSLELNVHGYSKRAGLNYTELSRFLQQLPTLGLTKLTIRAHSLNLEQQYSLSRCAISRSLTLRFQEQAHRLEQRFLPACPSIAYQPF